MKLPQPVPELPVDDIESANLAYAARMGFHIDWVYDGQLAGISRDAARIFLRKRTDQERAVRYCVLIWMNMDSAADVDQLHAEWKAKGVDIVKDLETASHNLREFTGQDVDGNRFRVFYDLGTSREG